MAISTIVIISTMKERMAIARTTGINITRETHSTTETTVAASSLITSIATITGTSPSTRTEITI